MSRDSKLTLISLDNIPQMEVSSETTKDQVSLKQDDSSSVHGDPSVPTGEQQLELQDSKFTLISGDFPQMDASKETPKDQVSLKQDESSSVHGDPSVPSGEQQLELQDSKLTLVSGDLPQTDASKETPKDQVSLKQDDGSSVHSDLSIPSGEQGQEQNVAEESRVETKKWTIPPVLVVPAPSLQTVSSNESFESLEKELDDSVEKILGQTPGPSLNEAEVEAANVITEEARDTAPGEDSDSMHSLLNCRICQLFVRTVDRLLDKSEEMMDRYMPLTEEEIDNLKQAVKEMDAPPDDHQKMACLERITALSSRLRQQAYMMALGKLRLARRNTHSNLSQLQLTMDLIERSQQEAEPAFRKSHEKLNEMCSRWIQERQSVGEIPAHEQEGLLSASNAHIEAGTPLTEANAPLVEDRSPVEVGLPRNRSTTEPGMSPLVAHSSQMKTGVASFKDLSSKEAQDVFTVPDSPEEEVCPSIEVESRTLQMSRSLTFNLQDTYKNLLANLKDLPLSLKHKLYQSYLHMTELNAKFSTAHSFSDLPGSILAKGLEIMAQAQECMDEVMEFAFQHPLGLLSTDRPPAPVTTETSSAEREEGDILKIQAAYEPKGCDENVQ